MFAVCAAMLMMLFCSGCGGGGSDGSSTTGNDTTAATTNPTTPTITPVLTQISSAETAAPAVPVWTNPNSGQPAVVTPSASTINTSTTPSTPVAVVPSSSSNYAPTPDAGNVTPTHAPPTPSQITIPTIVVPPTLDTTTTTIITSPPTLDTTSTTTSTADSTPPSPNVISSALIPLLVKSGDNYFLGVKKTDGVYLQKYDASYRFIGEIPIHIDTDVNLNGYFSPTTAGHLISIFTTKQAIAPGQSILNNFGEVFLIKVDADRFTITGEKISVFTSSTRIQSINFYRNDTFFQILYDVAPLRGQYLGKVDFNGNNISTKPLWASNYYFTCIAVNANRIFLVGLKLQTNLGDRVCTMILDKDWNVLGESVFKPFTSGVMADWINSFTVTPTDMRISITYQENASTPATTGLFSIDFATGAYTPVTAKTTNRRIRR